MSEQATEAPAVEPAPVEPAAAPAEPAAEAPAPAPAAVDLQAQVEALQSQLAQAEAQRAATLKEAEEKIKTFQESFGAEKEAVAGDLAAQYQRLAEEQKKLQAQNDAIADQQWAMALDKMGVLDAYKDMVPRIDLSTKEGQAKLEKFAETHPAIIKKKAVEPMGVTESMSQRLKDILSGKTKSAFVTKESIAKTMGN